MDAGGVTTVFDLLQAAGAQCYGGEAVSQLEHALQCAQMAQVENAPPELVVAALLHDVGHLLYDLGENAARHGVDDQHQLRAMHLLRRIFDSAVTEPIRLHVDAKRYLCHANSAYFKALSPASKASLSIQGGVYSADEARRFIEQPYARDAVRLRTWDDRAKAPGTVTPDLAHFEKLMRQCEKQHTANRG